MTFDIVHVRYRYTISIVKIFDIDVLSISNVYDIEYFVRYRASGTRYRGAKVPDAGPALSTQHSGGWHGASAGTTGVNRLAGRGGPASASGPVTVPVNGPAVPVRLCHRLGHLDPCRPRSDVRHRIIAM